MESVFVGENLIDINPWSNVGNQLEKLKIGEVYQLINSSLSICCSHCTQEFQYFTEFSLHIQEHYLRGEIAQLKEIKEEAPNEFPVESIIDESMPETEHITISPEIKCEVFDYDNEDNDFQADWSEGEVENNNHLAEEPEVIQPLSVKTNLSPPIIEGTDYEKNEEKFKCLTCEHETDDWDCLTEHLLSHSSPKGVLCPICSKLFAKMAYVQKHVHRTHNLNISIAEIKQAQPNIKPTAVPVIKLKTKVKIYNEGIDYRRVGTVFECLTCNRRMTKFDHMKEHLLTHSNDKNVLCPFCARAFITESYVRKHVNRTHKMRITAEEIKAAQSTIDITQTQKEWATEKDKQIAESNKTRKLNVNVSGDEKAIQCLFCEKRFTKARYVQKHMRLIHAKPMTIGDVMNLQPVRQAKKETNESINTLDNPEYKKEDDNKNTIKELPVVSGENGTGLMKNFECFECHKQFVSVNSVRIHLKLHSGIKYNCPHCHKLFAMKSYVRDHIVIVHGIKRDDIPKESIRQATGSYIYTPRPIVEVFECYLCKNQYKKRNRLREHMHSHISGPYLCVICGAVYKSTDTLRHHMERHKANPDEPHQCTECGKTYPTRRYMLSHYRTIHLKKRRYKPVVAQKCEVSCEICDKKFLSRHNLNQHMTVHNRDPKWLICHICHWEFKERSNLKQHLESHGNNKIACEVCNKVLSHRYMHEHMKIHTGNKEFQCSACGKQFVSRERLKRHMVRHSGEPKYKCDLCPKAYTRSDKLLYHRRSHDQQMTHTCQSCGKGFFSIKSLRKHKNKHYLEENGLLKTPTSDLSIPQEVK